jgi:putative phage-type endonuclease
MPITEAQRELRKQHLGSSDMAAIMGFDKFKTAYDVWLDKTDKVVPEEETAVMYAGTMFEDGVLKFAEGQLGDIIRNQYRRAAGLPIGSNVDGIVKITGQPVEAKTAGLFGPVHDVWGDDGTDQVPDRVIIQSHVHMLCCEADVCHVAAFVGGRGFLLYHVNRDMDIIETITNTAIDFWNNHVLKDIPPENAEPSLQLVKRMKREPNKTVQVDDELASAWLKANEELGIAKKKEEQAKAQFIAAIGDAEAATCTHGTFTYFETTRKGYVVKDTKFRTLRFKK